MLLLVGKWWLGTRQQPVPPSKRPPAPPNLQIQGGGEGKDVTAPHVLTGHHFATFCCCLCRQPRMQLQATMAQPQGRLLPSEISLHII